MLYNIISYLTIEQILPYFTNPNLQDRLETFNINQTVDPYHCTPPRRAEGERETRNEETLYIQ